MKAYRHLFFDLDHTLWDFETNAHETLEQLFAEYDLGRHGLFSFAEFSTRYRDVNHALWRLYQSNKVTQQQLREVRFVRTLTRLGVAEADVPTDMSARFTDILPYKAAVFPHTHDVLDYLQGKGYHLHLITNGFEDVQHIKLQSSDLKRYFEEVITSEHSGHLKPDPRMFAHALARTGATAAESLMVGDNLECDVLGAYNSGIDQVYFNPDKRRHFAETTYEISSLAELRDFL
ncbi:noncanonical pyrimidine nucleotidase, YjjG family [Hymenobacter sp. UV11]|uniref:YjjG family noncanonical pyrimidine nucleotidase n=1 Tax=Hymenobacter sp. UV11 TaxID=1849735 RepID=UPI0010609903|nr:YjjG family noncanonical pyrimidine nucleotidase [Hymenobacter sp. UV11]TDN39920.1 noncanonical pyrimidine nucleotidase, YjjG family [Hymenobacter sp. UV11]TFZ67510.1 noncanonical pyrimidine nucleotidase, YjjG family [Hymenobacter sp. UV11]